ncbi:hypothetical protein AAK899_08600 [Erysipelotrichaceae bacterium 51-3]
MLTGLPVHTELKYVRFKADFLALFPPVSYFSSKKQHPTIIKTIPEDFHPEGADLLENKESEERRNGYGNDSPADSDSDLSGDWVIVWQKEVD